MIALLRAPKTESDQARIFAQFRAERDIAPKMLYVAVAALSVACVGLLGLNYQAAHRDHGAVVVGIDTFGNRTFLGYSDTVKYDATQELFRRLFKRDLTQFMRSYYGRNRATAREDFSRSTQFLSPQTSAQRMARERSDKSLERFLGGDADSVDVTVENVILGELKAAPYTAQIDLVKVYRGHDGSEIRREKCVETVTFDLAKEVPNSMIETNPLGITVTALPVEDVAMPEGK